MMQRAALEHNGRLDVYGLSIQGWCGKRIGQGFSGKLELPFQGSCLPTQGTSWPMQYLDPVDPPRQDYDDLTQVNNGQANP